jgi:hypothetical protein
MDTSLLQRSRSVEDEAEFQQDSDSEDAMLTKVITSKEKVQELKLKELPLVHQTRKRCEK